MPADDESKTALASARRHVDASVQGHAAAAVRSYAQAQTPRFHARCGA